ncbi:MAG: hypothetical protein ACM30E_03210 [Nitrososphaerales archaeon]
MQTNTYRLDVVWPRLALFGLLLTLALLIPALGWPQSISNPVS